MSDLKTNCPVCGEEVNVAEGTEVSEIINCPSCGNRLVVESVSENEVTLKEAPKIEEDWGE